MGGKMNKTLSDILYWSVIIMLVAFIIATAINNRAYAASFPAYQYIELQELADHSDKYNSEEIQIKGVVKDINEYTGVYGGIYIGLTTDFNITIYFYAKDGVASLAIGDHVLVYGVYHKYALYGGTGHSDFIATHHLERLE